MNIDLNAPHADRIVTDDCISDLRFDRMLAGELGPEERRPIEAHMQACDHCRARHGELQADFDAFPQKVWVTGLAMETLRRDKGHTTRRVFAIAATIAMCVVGASLVQRAMIPSDEIRVKGAGPKLEVFARFADGRVEEVAPGASLAPGTALRFRVTTDPSRFIGVVGFDSAGVVSGYYPEQGPLLSATEVSGKMLEGSIILDDTPGVERLFVVACAKQLGVEDVIAAVHEARQAASDNDPRAVRAIDTACEQTTFLFSKQVSP